MKQILTSGVVAIALAATALGQTAQMGAETGTYTGNTRGYWFTAPSDFVITGVQVLNQTGATNDFQNYAILRFDGATPPPVFSMSTNAFTQLALGQDEDASIFEPVSVQIYAGDVIGIYGNTTPVAGDTTGANSYAGTIQQTTNIAGDTVDLFRSGMQFHLGSATTPAGMQDVWGEPGSTNITRVEFTYMAGRGSAAPDIIDYDFDTNTALNEAAPGGGFAVGLPGLAVGFGSGGICPGSGDPAALSTGGGVDSRIDTGWETDLGTGSFSIGCWLDNTIGAGNTNFFQYVFGDSAAGGFRSFCEGAAGDGNIILRGPFDQVIITGGVSDTAPTHVCWVYDAPAQEIRGYLNGVLNVTVAQTNPIDLVGSAGSTFTVVGYNGSSSSMQAGTAMDDFRLYGFAINERTIGDWAGCETPEIIKYDFDAGDATNSASPGGGLAVGAPGTGISFGPGGICEGAGDPAGLSSGALADSRIDTGWEVDLGTSSFTIGCWLDNTVGAGNTNFFQYIFGDSDAGSFRSFCEGAAGDGNIILRGPLDQVVITGGVSDTEPTHVCWIYDAPAQEIRGYLNGVLNVTVAQTSPLNINGTGAPAFTVMGYNGSTSSMQAGTVMDDFRLYRRAISEQALAEWSGCASTTIGTNYCVANANSTGAVGVISATGSTFVTNNDLTLGASSLPTNAFAQFLASQDSAYVLNPGGSSGNICIGGSVGRKVGGVIPNSGMSGSVSVAVDLNAISQPNGDVIVLPGATWFFQCWYRDAVGGMATSNFTDAVEIRFQ